jgi:hypothetical protein
MEVLRSDYHGAALFGDRREIACIPHQGCWLEIVATAETAHHEVNLLRPGQVLQYKRSFFTLDRLELPSRTKVGLWHFVGFKLRLPASLTPPPQTEDIIVALARGEHCNSTSARLVPACSDQAHRAHRLGPGKPRETR